MVGTGERSCMDVLLRPDVTRDLPICACPSVQPRPEATVGGGPKRFRLFALVSFTLLFSGGSDLNITEGMGQPAKRTCEWLSALTSRANANTNFVAKEKKKEKEKRAKADCIRPYACAVSRHTILLCPVWTFLYTGCTKANH